MVTKTILVAYDISGNKRRVTCSEFLEQYGMRVNKSVFICSVEVGQMDYFLFRLSALIQKKDRIVYIPLCKRCEDEIVVLPADTSTPREIRTRFI